MVEGHPYLDALELDEEMREFARKFVDEVRGRSSETQTNTRRSDRWRLVLGSGTGNGISRDYNSQYDVDW